MNGAVGGAALSTIGLMEALGKIDVESSAVCDPAGTDEEFAQLREATAGRVEFTPLYWWNRKIRAKAWKRPLLELRQIARTGWLRTSARHVANFARRHEADLIHTNTILTPEGARAARQLGLAHVWHVRELLGPGQPFRLPVEGQRFGTYMQKNCSKLVANSNVTASHIQSWIPPGLLEVVPNGIDTTRFSPRTGPRGTDLFVIGMVASLTSRWKKHALLVEAASRVSRKLNAEFRIYGHDPSRGGTVAGDAYTNQLHELIRARGVADRFTWPGFIADPIQIMSQIDVLVHPATDESFGRAVVEAMAAGVPVIGVRGGGVAEVVEHEKSGLLAAVDDPAELARHIERVLENPELYCQLSEGGRRRAETEYSLESCAKRIRGVYDQAMKRPLSS